MKKIWIFDLDGTLVDSLGSIAECANKILSDWGYEPIPATRIKDFVGNGAKVLTGLVCRERNIPEAEREEYYTEYFDYYMNNPIGGTAAFEGIAELLHELKRRSIKIAILTNKPDGIAKTSVEGIFGDGFFDMVLGQREDYRRKPDPEGISIILNTFGLKPEDCLYLGDMDVDLKTGQNAGVDTVLVSWGFKTHEELELLGDVEIVDRVEELYGYIG